MSFHSERTIKAIRKARQCDACSTMVEVGETAIGWAGVTDGDFGTCTYHPECRVAEIAINRLHGTRFDEWMGLGEMEWDDHEWLLVKHPTVAARMRITAETVAENAREREECRIAWTVKAKGDTK